MPLTDADYEEALAHFGRKGMKWGEHVYGEEKTSSKTVRVRTPKEQELHDINVRAGQYGAAAGLGVTIATAGIGLPVAAAIGAGVYFATKHSMQKASAFNQPHKAAGKATVDRYVSNSSKK
jgi:hypothetical protein